MYICVYVLNLITHFTFFFFHDTATTEIYTLSLHDALPISRHDRALAAAGRWQAKQHDVDRILRIGRGDRAGKVEVNQRRSEEHTLNSSHANISYAVFCLKKKKRTKRK